MISIFPKLFPPPNKYILLFKKTKIILSISIHFSNNNKYLSYVHPSFEKSLIYQSNPFRKYHFFINIILLFLYTIKYYLFSTPRTKSFYNILYFLLFFPLKLLTSSKKLKHLTSFKKTKNPFSTSQKLQHSPKTPKSKNLPIKTKKKTNFRLTSGRHKSPHVALSHPSHPQPLRTTHIRFNHPIRFKSPHFLAKHNKHKIKKTISSIPRILRTLRTHTQNSLIWAHVKYPNKTLLSKLQLMYSYPSNIHNLF